MKTAVVPVEQHAPRNRGREATPPLREPWPRLWQLGWVALAILVAGLLVFRLRQTVDEAHSLCKQTGCDGPQLLASQLHLLRSAGVSIDLYGYYAAAVIVIFVAGYWALAGIIIARKPADRMAVVTAFTLLLFGALTFDSNTTSTSPPDMPAALWALDDALSLLGGCAMFVFFLLFPNGRLVLRWPVLLMAPLNVFLATEMVSSHTSFHLPALPLLLTGVWWALAFAGAIYVQIFRYRYVSNAVERQQTKVAVFGIALAVVIQTGAFALYPIAEMTGNAALGFIAFPGTHAAGLLIPLAIGVAVLRHRLWDIDLLINRTLVYALLTASLAVVYAGGVIGLQALFRVVTGQHTDLAVVISTLAIAALFNPLRHGFQAFIDRRFYRRKYDAARTVAAFQSALRDEVDLGHLSMDLVSVIKETMEPAHVSLWLRNG